MTRSTGRGKTVAALGAAVAMLLTACGGSSGSSGSSGGGSGESTDALSGASLTVGAKEFTESAILQYITIAALTNAGAQATDVSLSGSATVREALLSKDLDMYWDYTGTGWVNILGNTTTDIPSDLYQAVSDADKANGVAWLKPAPLNDTYRIAVNSDFASQNNLATMSDAAAYIQANPDQGTLCAASEFINRDDGLPGLEKAYGFKFSNVNELDLSLVYTQVGSGCNFGEVFSTDGRIIANKLTALEDDKNFFVEYKAALTMRQETLDKYPAIADIMAPISEALTDKVMTELNAKVDVDGETAKDVANQWMQDMGFVG